LLLFIDLRMALCLLLLVAMIDVHLMAWKWSFDIVLDGTLYFVCLMAVELPVEYSIRMCLVCSFLPLSYVFSLPLISAVFSIARIPVAI